MNEAFLQLLGLAMRAGKVISGEPQVILGMRNQQVHLTILAEDASPNTKKKVTDKATTFDVPVLYGPSREELGRALGKDERVVAGVLDAGFAKGLMKRYER